MSETDFFLLFFFKSAAALTSLSFALASSAGTDTTGYNSASTQESPGGLDLVRQGLGPNDGAVLLLLLLLFTVRVSGRVNSPRAKCSQKSAHICSTGNNKPRFVGKTEGVGWGGGNSQVGGLWQTDIPCVTFLWRARDRANCAIFVASDPCEK